MCHHFQRRIIAILIAEHGTWSRLCKYLRGIYQRQFSEMVAVFLVINSLFVLPQFTVAYTMAIGSRFLRWKYLWYSEMKLWILWQAVTHWLSELEVRRLLTSTSRGFAVWTFYKLHCLTFSLGGLTSLPDSSLVCGSHAEQDYAYVYPWNGGCTLLKLHAQHWLIMPLLLVMESMTRKGLCLLTESTSGCHTAVHSRGLILSWFTSHPVHGCNSSRCATCW